jgi:hypothetical protein
MLKRNVLNEINAARLAHAKWVRRAKHLVENLPVTEEMIPMDSTECAFGRWFFSNGMKFRILNNFGTLVDQINLHHTQVHDIYLHIYKIYFLDTKRSWMMNMLTKTRKEVSIEGQRMAYRYFTELENASESLTKILDQFEREVAILDEAKLMSVA